MKINAHQALLSVASIDARLQGAVDSLLSVSATDADRENKLEAVAKMLEPFGIDLREADTDAAIIDAMTQGIMSMSVQRMAVNRVEVANYKEIDLDTEDPKLAVHYERLRNEFEEKLKAFRPIEVLDRFSYPEYWSDLTREERVVRSSYLLDYASSNNIVPSPVWVTVYGTNGTKVGLDEAE